MKQRIGFLFLLCILVLSISACKKVPEPVETEQKGGVYEAASGQEESTETEQEKEYDSYEDSPGWDGIHDTEPVDYMAVEIKRDPSITEEQREYFFEFARTYYLSGMRYFKDGQPAHLDDFKWYCVCLYPEKVKDLAFPAEIIEKVASEYFGWSYGLKEGETVPLEIGSWSGLPTAELINYKEEKAGDRTLVTLRYADYSVWPLWDLDKKRQEEHEKYAPLREQIIKGNVTQKYNGLAFFDVQYYAEDENNPIRFMSFKTYDYDNVPAFIK